MITREQIIENVLKKYEDPELMIDVWTLGLIYEVLVEKKVVGRKIVDKAMVNKTVEEGVKEKVKIKLTFTSPLCPYGLTMAEELKSLILKEGAAEVEIEVTFEPPWRPSEELKEILGVL